MVEWRHGKNVLAKARTSSQNLVSKGRIKIVLGIVLGNGEKPMSNAAELVVNLLKSLDRREQDYLKAMDSSDQDAKVSFTARAAEVGIFRTDLEILLEKLEEGS